MTECSQQDYPERRLKKRLIILSFLSASIWFISIFNQYYRSLKPIQHQSIMAWPQFKQWRSFELSRPGEPLIKVFKKDSTSSAWFTQVADQPIRRIDPFIEESLAQELKQVKPIETRQLNQRDETKALALTEVALTLTLTTQDDRKHIFRIGAEHQKHSTWILPLETHNLASKQAIRVIGRLRRALDHRAYQWPDRRVGSAKELTQVSCGQGRLDLLFFDQSTPSFKRSWTLERDLKEKAADLAQTKSRDWQIKGLDPSPRLHEATVNSLIYTVKSLKMSRFLDQDEFVNAWQATHYCTWQEMDGQKGGFNIGRAKLNLNSLPSKDSLQFVLESKKGLGLIPSHIAHILMFDSSALLDHQLSILAPDEIAEWRYQSTLSPLLIQSLLPSWKLYQDQLSWWLQFDHQEAKPIPKARRRALFEALSQKAAKAEHISVLASKERENVQASLTFTVSDRACQKLKLNHCQFELRHLATSSNQGLAQWYRPHDGALFTLSQMHHQRLIQAGLP